MLKTVRKAFQIEDIRKRLFYTFLMLIVVRFGSQLPTPGVDPTYIQNLLASQNNGAYSFFDAFTGGSFTRMSVFALSITPYITSSIIMQLLTIAIPKLEEMQKEGAEGRKKIAAITRYVTVALALIESIAMSIGFGRQGLLEEFNFVNVAIVVCTLTAGSAFLMWIGERITEKGVVLWQQSLSLQFCWQLCYLLSFCRMVREGLQYSIPRKYREEGHMVARLHIFR